MRIAQINPGLIEIPPKGWGAVEKVIYNYHKQMIAAGHQCDIKYMNEIVKGDYDIVHVHMANQALYLKDRGIPYIFSIHDHHAEYYGNQSPVYAENYKAIKGSIFSLTHAYHYKKLFEECQNLFFLSHGVDTDIYKPYDSSNPLLVKPQLEPNILMVGTNGLAGDIGVDRKGFGFGIQIASLLRRKILLVGGTYNNQWKDKNRSLFRGSQVIEYDFDNCSEEKLVEHYNQSTVFFHWSKIEAGMPNLTLLEALACGLPVVCNGKQFPKELTSIGNFIKCDDIYDARGSIDYIFDTRYYPNIGLNKIDSVNLVKKYFDWSVIVNRLLWMYGSIMTKPVIDTATTTKLYRQLLND